jgi:hypothetical protein
MRLQGQTLGRYRVLDALGLAVVTYATQVTWLLIPCAILFGSGLITAYSRLIGNGVPWASLWPLDAVLVGGSVWLAIRLAYEEGHSRRPARPLGRTPCIVSAFCVAVAIRAVTVTALVQRLLAAVH